VNFQKIIFFFSFLSRVDNSSLKSWVQKLCTIPVNLLYFTFVITELWKFMPFQSHTKNVSFSSSYTWDTLNIMESARLSVCKCSGFQALKCYILYVIISLIQTTHWISIDFEFKGQVPWILMHQNGLRAFKFIYFFSPTVIILHT
jgi:hypothetical protein